MKPQTRSNEAGWVLLEAVLLGMIVLGTAAAIGIFARTALLEEHTAARMEAALLARARFSMMEADLDRRRLCRSPSPRMGASIGSRRPSFGGMIFTM